MSERKDLECSVCFNYFNRPVTLMCQHTYCMNCIVRVDKCPLCRVKAFIPPAVNPLIAKLVIDKIGQEAYDKRTSEFKEESDDRKKESEVRRQVFRELIHTIHPPTRPAAIKTTIGKLILHSMLATVIDQPLETIAVCLLLLIMMYKF